MEIFQFWDKYSLITQNAFISSEWNRIWVFTTFKLKCRRRDQISQPFCKLVPPNKLCSPSLWAFWKSQKSTPESCRELWNQRNDKEFGSLKLLKLKYKRGDEIIHPSCIIGLPQEIRSPLFHLQKFYNFGKSTP